MIEFDNVRLHAHITQESLGSLAVGAVGLGENSYPYVQYCTLQRLSASHYQVLTNWVVIDDLLRFRLCGHDGFWVGSACREDFASERVLRVFRSRFADSSLQEVNVGQRLMIDRRSCGRVESF